ncbi:hypothetical protein JMJ35_005868 [Cladonia borealis]|uniref:Rhodopsin domain-containing protein n=1 Tax=Cladonia borealis TaxID=184061 RepID=A0AA39R053_9LECA|nr:hypothetical protein JMJ35_005868 [Cladonia borealis]
MNPLPPPAGGDQNRGPSLLAMWWTEVSISIIMVIMRLCSRYRLKNVGIDDWLIVAALILYVSTTIALTFNLAHGGARHLYYLTQSEIEYTTKVTWIENPLGIMALVTAKISVAFLILRLIGPSTIWRKWSLYVSIVLNLIFAVLACILTFVQCNPPRALWEAPSQVPGAKCWNPKPQADYAIFSSAFFAFTDFFLAAIPITFIWNLKLGVQKKIALSMLLGVGAFAGICSSIKTSYLKELTARADFTWATYDLAAWTGAETFLIIFCACIPTLRPIYDSAREKSYFSLSYFTSKISSLDRRSSSYGFNSARKQTYHKHSDSNSPGHILRVSGTDKGRGIPTKATSLSETESAGQWGDGDSNALIGMGSINVQREYEVHHGDIDLQGVPSSNTMASAPANFTNIRSDDIV